MSVMGKKAGRVQIARAIEAKANRERRAGGNCPDVIQLPTLQERGLCSFRVFRQRQIPGPVESKTLPYGEGRQSAICCSLIPVRYVLYIVVEVLRVDAARVIHRVSESLRKLRSEPPRITLNHAQLS